MSSATIFGSEGNSSSVSLGADISVGVISDETRRFFRLCCRGESSLMLRLPYVRNGLARGRNVDGAGLSDLFPVSSINLLNLTFWRTFLV